MEFSLILDTNQILFFTKVNASTKTHKKKTKIM